MQDQTLADYISRTLKRLEKENKQPEPEQYKVLPEDDGTDSKSNNNPYSQH